MEKSGQVVALARAESTPALGLSGSVQITGLGEVFRLAERLAEARGFVPKNLAGDPNAIAAAILTGLELGIGPMEAMRSIHMVDGKPMLSADMMLARAIRAGVRVSWEQTDDRAAVVVLERGGQRHRHSWTIEEATRAGLAGRDNWKKYPSAMLRARCISAAMRAFCPDVLGSGVYVEGEIEPATSSVPVVTVEPAPVAKAAKRVDVEIEDGLIVSVPEKLADIANGDELRAWCTHRAGAIAAMSLSQRAKLTMALRTACERTGEDFEAIVLRAGLARKEGGE